MSTRVPLPIVVCLVSLCLQAHADAQTSTARYPGFGYRRRFVPAQVKPSSPSTSPESAAPLEFDRSPQTVQEAEFISASAGQPDEWPKGLSGPDDVDAPYLMEPMPDQAVGSWDAAHYLMPAPCPMRRLWGRAEYLMWWTSGMDLPPLATTSPDGTPSNQAGVLGQPGTTVLFRNVGQNDPRHSGARITLGMWLDSCQGRGLDVSYLTLGSETESFSASNNDLSILARPFFNVQNSAQDARLIVFPDEVSGTLDIQVTSDMQAFGALYRVSALNGPGGRSYYLLGYRFVELEDTIGIRESTLALAGPIAGATFDLLDQFNTRNVFHGGEFGLAIAGERRGRWSWEAVVKVALGQTKSRASVFGQTTITALGATATTPAGLLAQSTNIGTHKQSNFSAVGEFGLTLRRYFRCGLTASLGYTFLYWSDVARAGDQIDLDINTSQIPPGMLVGSAQPAFAFVNSGFRAQGLRVGLEYAY